MGHLSRGLARRRWLAADPPLHGRLFHGRDRWFESVFLQRRVNKLSVRLAVVGDREVSVGLADIMLKFEFDTDAVAEPRAAHRLWRPRSARSVYCSPPTSAASSAEER